MRQISYVLTFAFFLFIPLHIFAQSSSNASLNNSVSSFNKYSNTPTNYVYSYGKNFLSKKKPGQMIKVKLTSGEAFEGQLLFYDNDRAYFLTNGYTRSITLSAINDTGSKAISKKLKCVVRGIVFYPSAFALYGTVVLPINFVAYIESGAFRTTSFRKFLRS
jgi:hypothetical protein